MKRGLLAGTLVATVAFAPAAHAAEAVVTPTRIPGFPPYDDLVYRADPGEANDLTISRDRAGVFTIEDRGATIRPAGSCDSIDAHRVVCRARRLLTFATVSLGDGDDQVAASIAPGTPWAELFHAVFAGPGNDRISLAATPGRGRPGGRGSDITNRGSFRGFYAVRGDEGDDVVSGSADDDLIDGGPGRDLLGGGGGDDSVSGGEGDDLVGGGAGADFVLGSALGAFELGRPQPADQDAVGGDAGADLVAGGPGGDRLLGGPGHDALLYAPRLSHRRGPLPRLRVSFDGLANDGVAGEGDNVERPDVESAIALASGGVSIAGRLAFRGGRYTLTGGRSTRAKVILLSTQGTSASQSGTFSGSSFSVRAGRLRGRVTEIAPVGGSFRACRSGTSGSRAEAAQLSRRTIRRLRARARGRFRTRGRHSATTVRGTSWTVSERCDGTLTTVHDGSVAVRDFVRRRTLVVRAGERYLARGRPWIKGQPLQQQRVAGRHGVVRSTWATAWTVAVELRARETDALSRHASPEMARRSRSHLPPRRAGHSSLNLAPQSLLGSAPVRIRT